MNINSSQNLIALFPFISDKLLRNNDQRVALDHVLESLGKSTDADRVYFFLNINQNGVYGAKYFSEWCKKGVSAEIENPNVAFVVWEEIKALYQMLNTHNSLTFHVNEIDESDNSLAVIKYLLESQDIVSLHLVKVYYEDWFIGFVGFDSCFKKRIWNTEEVKLLEYLADMIAHRYVRDAAKLKAEKFLEATKRRNEFLVSIRDVSHKGSKLLYSESFFKLISGVEKLVKAEFFAICVFKDNEYDIKVKNEVGNEFMEDLNLLVLKKHEILKKNSRLIFVNNKLQKVFSNSEQVVNNLFMQSILIADQYLGTLVYVNLNEEQIDDLKTDLDIIHDVCRGLVQSFIQFQENLKIQEKIKEQKTAFEEVLEHSLSGYWYWDVLSSKETVSVGFHDTLGYRELSQQIESLKQVLTDKDKQKFEKKILSGAWYESSNSYSEELNFIHSSGKIITMQMSLSVIDRDTMMKPNRIIACFVDVTANTKLREQLHSNLTKEKELNRMKSYFVSLVSHQFRTPMTIIHSNAQLINKNLKLNRYNDVKNNLSRIEMEIDKMNDLISKVLIVEKLRSSKVENEAMKETDIVQFIKNQLTRYEDPRNNIRFICSVEELRITINTFKLENIFDNLLSNAIKYCDNKQVVIRIKDGVQNIILQVEDFGIGIPKDEQVLVFEPFNRGSNVSNFAGTGLGLSIVKELCSDLRIKINLHSEPGNTIFELKIPK